MVFFQTRAIPVKGSGIGFNISTRVACRVFITPDKLLSRQAKITDMDVQPLSELEIKAKSIRDDRANIKAEEAIIGTPDPALEGAYNAGLLKLDKSATAADAQVKPAAELQSMTRPYPTTKVKVVFENTGQVRIGLKGTVEVRSEEGQLLARGVLPAALVLSGAKREIWAHLDKPLLPGTYRFKAIIDYGAKELMSGELKAQVNAPTAAALETVPGPNLINKAEQKDAAID